MSESENYTERLARAEARVNGLEGNVEDCKKDRDDLFDFKNDHESRIKTVEVIMGQKDRFDQNILSMKRYMLTTIIIMIGMVATLVFGIISIKKAEGGDLGVGDLLTEALLQYDQQERIQIYLKEVNNREDVRMEYCFHFGCNNPKNRIPILLISLPQFRCGEDNCVECFNELKPIAEKFSKEWKKITGSCVVYVMRRDEMVYFVDRYGKFLFKRNTA